MKVRVKDNPNAPIRIFDESNPNGSGLTEKIVHFNIEPFELTSANTRIEYRDQTYGNIGKPEVYTTINGSEIKLREGQDYEIKAFPNSSTKVGTYTLQIFGKNNYTGNLEKTFKVIGKNISNSDVSIENIKDYN